MGILPVTLLAKGNAVPGNKKLLQTQLKLKEIISQHFKFSNAELTDRIEHLFDENSKPYYKNILKKLALDTPENAFIICEYIETEITQINIKQSTKEGKIKILVWLSNYLSGKPFFEMTKQHILRYLNSLRKSISDDPSQRWIGSYNGRQMIILKFFKWLYNPDEADSTKRITPPCMQGVNRLPRREKTPYKYNDIWDIKEHAIFLKYCPDKRDRCYHALANDMSARPHEILNLRISDIRFNVTENGTQYAEVRISDGKTGPRTVPLIDSLPYLKEWIEDHPSGNSPESWLFVSKSTNTYGTKLTYDGLAYRYSDYYKKIYFPKLLADKSVPESDKAFIRNLLTKPWNVYILRHSALTEKSQFLSDSALKDHAGWSMSSKMPQVYVHLRGESSKLLLEQRGIMKKQDQQTAKALKARQCTNCSEPNKPDSKFCSRCRMILSYEAYKETIDQQKQNANRLEKLENQTELNTQFQKEMLECLKHPEKLAQIARSMMSTS